MIKEYLVKPSNSTVNGEPSFCYDWKLFDWEGKDFYTTPFIDTRGIEVAYRAPKPRKDGIPSRQEYLHVAYKFAWTFLDIGDGYFTPPKFYKRIEIFKDETGYSACVPHAGWTFLARCVPLKRARHIARLRLGKGGRIVQKGGDDAEKS